MADYGMLGVLLLLCSFFSWRTWDEQHPAGTAAAAQLASLARQTLPNAAQILIVARDQEDDRVFSAALSNELHVAGFRIAGVIHGEPADARRAMSGLATAGGALDAIVCNHATAAWPVFQNLGDKFPSLAKAAVLQPRSYHWPNFLKADNLLNIANQIVVIAIIAIGMTLVIITGGIDLSVGSIVALSAVAGTWLIAHTAGAEQAGAGAMICAGIAGIVVGALMGLFSGAMITGFGIPPFIVTLAMMLVGSGLAYLLARGEPIYQLPESFIWLGRGTVGGGLPIAVVLMGALYVIAHVMMSRMALGRYLYAVGGNREAARLSGVPVIAVLLFAYTLSGALAGLGGIITASQLKSGSPNYGTMYELYVIAAVVVGGTSLSGGEGRILGTLIGAFIIAVIQNGMNLTGVESYTQKVVLGLVILGAVLLDMLKKRGWFRRNRTAPATPR